MTVLVCGGRGYRDYDRVVSVLSKIINITMIVSGGATGADALAIRYARERGIPYQIYPADWITHGRAAGVLRNQQMLDEAKPQLVIAFPGGKGTRDMKMRTRRAGIDLVEVLFS